MVCPAPHAACRVLLEAPALPQPAVRAFLAGLAGAGPEWCTLALLAARDCLLQRPPSRGALLDFVLEACASPTPDTRGKAVRLAANRLFPDPAMAPVVEQAARRRLDAMVPPPAPAAAAEPAAGGEAAPAAGAEAVPAAGAEVAGAKAAAAGAEAAAAGAEAGAAAGAEASPAASPPPAQEASPAASPQGEAAAAAGATAEAAAAATAEPAAAVKEEPQQAAEAAEAAPPGPTDLEAAQLCALYCALCTKKHSLLRRLFEVYGLTSGGLARPCGRAASLLPPPPHSPRRSCCSPI